MSYCKRLGKIKSATWLILFLLLGIFLYYRIFGNFFVSDDFHWLSIAKHTGWGIDIFLTNYQGDNQGGVYSPVLVLIFQLFYHLFALKYWAYHLASIVLHSVNAWLVYLLFKRLFVFLGKEKVGQWAPVAGLLFLFWPVHSEAVAWLSAWPHLWATMFYLLSFIFYLNFRSQGRWWRLLFSFIFFVLSLLVKEIAISLPFIIFIWEAYLSDSKTKKFSLYFSVIMYFVLLAAFLLVRYFVTGIFFGYYGSSSLAGSLTGPLGNFFVVGLDMFTFGFLRIPAYKLVYYYPEALAILILVSLASYFLFLLLKKNYLQFTLFFSFLLALSPMLLLGMHRTSFAGQRYLYLPLVFLIFWLLYLLFRLSWPRIVKAVIVVIFFLIGLPMTYDRLDIWRSAADLSRQIVLSYQEIDRPGENTFLSVGLPDNLSGAEVFRNNLEQALEFYYPDNPPTILPIYAYVTLNRYNKNEHLIKWRPDSLGWFAESNDGGFVVTGLTSMTVNGVYWELWNYNYQNYTANLIRLMPQAEMMEKIKSGQVSILTFDRGRLSIVE